MQSKQHVNSDVQKGPEELTEIGTAADSEQQPEENDDVCTDLVS